MTERRGDEPDEQQPQEDTQPMEVPADGPDPAAGGETSQDEPEP
jgi:hypothetical protein